MSGTGRGTNITFFPNLPRCSLLRHCHTINHPTRLPSRSRDGLTSEKNVNSGPPAVFTFLLRGLEPLPRPHRTSSFIFVCPPSPRALSHGATDGVADIVYSPLSAAFPL
ncbi:hypothetical protein M404DRAFT_397473 [Pisolithus tinctorius Marx 270]|uniref:Uncharacterized protein n=1 Tax=Pisolithus tinctorius Marx 270 TaxID=870435 RepID=A0A0C3PH80_PISTI|nr:hypothetical protein M404DRAFT_397473 [Pisolithus tinctorius Marx 270]